MTSTVARVPDRPGSPGGSSVAGGTAAAPGPLPAWARDASDRLDLAALADRVVETDLSAAFEDLRAHPEFVSRLHASVLENLTHLRQVIGGRTIPADVTLVEPLALAGFQARLRLPQTALQRSYRVGFHTMLEAWSDQLVRRAEADDVARGEALQALRDLTDLLLDYQHHVASQVADSFARTDDALSRSREHVRHGLVRQLLRDGSTPLPPSDLVLLDYPLEASHLTVLLPRASETETRRIVTALRGATHARDTLVLPLDLASSAVWLARSPSAGWGVGSRTALVTCLRALGVEASVSEPHEGADGLRAGHQQVQAVQRVRAAWGADGGPTVLRHEDVSLEILLMADPATAAAFLRAELGDLGSDDDVCRRLRETVEASCRWGSHVATATHLHLHEHTVRNRLQKAAELLGRPLTERRTELQVALRLARLLSQDRG